jgi:hypothetical protein
MSDERTRMRIECRGEWSGGENGVKKKKDGKKERSWLKKRME